MSVKLDLKNKIINGDFSYFQRGVSFPAIANNIYHADRFHYIKTGAMVQTIARSTDVPTSSNSTYSLLSTVTTIDASIAAGDYTGILQHIEGNVLRSFKSKKMVMTFWVKAFKAGTYCISLRNGTATRSLVLEYTVNASNTWEKKIVRFTHDASGTWSYDNGIGLTAVFVQASGSTFNTTAGTWQNGQFFATANQVNGVDSLSNTFQLADICMVEDNEGQTRVPEFMYAGRDVFEELQLCQRYYLENPYHRRRIVGQLCFEGAELPVPMRIYPTLISGSTVSDGGVPTLNASGSATNQTIYINTTVNATANGVHQFYLKLDAEL